MKANDKKTKAGALVAWRPFSGMPRWEQEMERRFGQFFDGKVVVVNNQRHRIAPDVAALEKTIELHESADAIIAKAELPGVTKNQIRVNIVKRLLSIEGEKTVERGPKEESNPGSERASSRFLRAVELPADIELDQVKAVLKDGVLTIRLPKSEEARQNKVAVRIG
jgi:HSP20 family protein